MIYVVGHVLILGVVRCSVAVVYGLYPIDLLV